MKNSICLVAFIAPVLWPWICFSQVVSKSFLGPVSGATCPAIGIQYEVSRPSGFGACQINWTATNGAISGRSNQPTVNVRWNDTPGALGRITATFSNCGNNNSGEARYLEELILSVKNQGWGSYTNSVPVSYCTPPIVTILVPPMVVSGTGGFGEPPRQEVLYEWTLPTGWILTTGSLITNIPAITIRPTQCAVQGVVRVKGIISNITLCPSAAPSAEASVTLNATTPVVTVAPPAGFSGTTACNTTPVIFTATLSSASGCGGSNYTWVFPSGWKWRDPTNNQLLASPISTSVNVIDLIPSGASNDQGGINAQLILNCGSTIGSSPLVVSYVTPTVFGPDPLCTTGQFSVQNASGLSTTWASSNTNVMTINSSGLGTRIGSSSGSVTINATLPCPVSVQPKTIWVGWPDPTNNSLVYEYFHFGVNPINLNMSAVYQFAMQSVQGASSYNWRIPSRVGWSFWVYGSTGNPNFIQTGNLAGTYQLICTPRNICGTAGARFLNVVLGSGGGGTPLRVASPNPADEQLSMKLSDSEDVEAEVSLINSSLETIFRTIVKGKEVSIPTQSIPEGSYILKVVIGDQSTGYRVVIKH